MRSINVRYLLRPGLTSLVVTKQEILVMSFTVFFDAASRRHNHVILSSFGVYLFTVSVNLF